MTKTDLVYTALREMILSGDLPPGAAISKGELAEKLNASRQPISGAVDRLAFEGLVEIVPQHGSFVSQLDATAIADWFMIRTALEAECAARFAEANERPTEALERNLRYQRVAADAGDVTGFYELDVEFHRIITEFSASEMAQSMLRQAQANLDRARRALLPNPGQPARTLAAHEGIFEAISSSKGAKSAKLMRSHLTEVADLLQAFAQVNTDPSGKRALG
ncbi:GntR family transcriptional regulator [Qingshengfaniella alkalisoli]|uniref:GntR family transcriptional regulator n=1 Tax=Qingshengfaniella alkalisoli TaxID=2599296 RepID=UPI00143CE9AE|nr:GntR family transcriptional regulator [Qingshengfaniella alkalisoli]